MHFPATLHRKPAALLLTALTTAGCMLGVSAQQANAAPDRNTREICTSVKPSTCILATYTGNTLVGVQAGVKVGDGPSWNGHFRVTGPGIALNSVPVYADAIKTNGWGATPRFKVERTLKARDKYCVAAYKHVRPTGFARLLDPSMRFVHTGSVCGRFVYVSRHGSWFLPASIAGDR